MSSCSSPDKPAEKKLYHFGVNSPDGPFFPANDRYVWGDINVGPGDISATLKFALDRQIDGKRVYMSTPMSTHYIASANDYQSFIKTYDGRTYELSPYSDAKVPSDILACADHIESKSSSWW